MHIPDNYLSPSTCAVMAAAMIPVWTIAVKNVKAEVTHVKLPMLGISAAFSFILMMINVPLPGGTSGHAVGGTLIAVLVGPFSACIAITVALLIQALLFGDGGILAFGANCFNLAFVMPFLGYFVYRFIKERTASEKGARIGMAIGSYAGINVAALCTAIEFGIQPLLFRNAAGQPLYSPYPLSVSIPAMVLPHLLVVGIVEAVFSVAIYIFIKKVSPDAVFTGTKQKTKAIYGLLGALICIVPLGLLAAGPAWGEWGADEIKGVLSGGQALGYIPEGMKNGFSFAAIISDYTIKGLPEIAGYVLSAVTGAAILVILFKVLSRFIKDKTG